MADYKFTFKCRMCGEIFTESQTGDEKLANCCVLYAIFGKNTTTLHVQAPSMLSVHFKKDHFGVADFIGCKIEGET